jgi:hypothetical protein
MGATPLHGEVCYISEVDEEGLKPVWLFLAQGRPLSLRDKGQ